MAPPVAPSDHLLGALRAGDEAAFRALVSTHGAALQRVATTYVGSPAVAEEVVQETWLGVLRGLDGFEERSSLRTWIFRILTNLATNRAARERRSVPFSSLAGDEEGAQPEPECWSRSTAPGVTPEQRLLSAETRGRLVAAVCSLPRAQRTVIELRDIQGWPAHEVCQTLGISDGNQRVLLHRARTKVRAALRAHLDVVELPDAA